ncbi:MAG: hypothetical protein R3F14_17605 [Polyangiaceae bacterium]
MLPELGCAEAESDTSIDIAAEGLDGESGDRVEGGPCGSTPVAVASREPETGNGSGDEGEPGFVELSRVDRQALHADWHPAVGGVACGGGAPGGEADTEDARCGNPVVTARQETASAHEGIGDAEQGDRAIEERERGEVMSPEDERGGEGAEQEASVRRAADVEEGIGRPLEEGEGRHPDPLCHVASGERGGVDGEQRAALGAAVGAVPASEPEEGHGAEEPGEAHHRGVVGGEPGGQSMASEPVHQRGPHDRLRTRDTT